LTGPVLGEQTSWSWVNHRFVREHMAYLSDEAVLLYFFLSAVADKHGLSFYDDGTLGWIPTVLEFANKST
jgi:hypothetical protein